jgi:hypothetical protein
MYNKIVTKNTTTNNKETEIQPKYKTLKSDPTTKDFKIIYDHSEKTVRAQNSS